MLEFFKAIGEAILIFMAFAVIIGVISLFLYGLVELFTPKEIDPHFSTAERYVLQSPLTKRQFRKLRKRAEKIDYYEYMLYVYERRNKIWAEQHPPFLHWVPLNCTEEYIMRWRKIDKKKYEWYRRKADEYEQSYL